MTINCASYVMSFVAVKFAGAGRGEKVLCSRAMEGSGAVPRSYDPAPLSTRAASGVSNNDLINLATDQVPTEHNKYIEYVLHM